MLVSEAQIADAIRHAYRHEQVVVEGSGAVGIAALLGGELGTTGTTAIVLSGANIDMDLHRRIVSSQGPLVDGEPAQ